MDGPDLNLLVALEALLEEGNVVRAARRLQLSPSAMSRTLARLRETLGDPLLVRAGRGLVPSPRAVELRERLGALVGEARSVLQPAAELDPARIDRTFTLRCREGFVENFGVALLARLQRDAPGLRLHFLPKPEKSSDALRDGRVDLETGVLGKSIGPEVRSQALFRDRFVGVVRADHPVAAAPATLAGYLAARHVDVARRTAGASGPVDVALADAGLSRDIATRVGDHGAALALVRAMDLVATVPERATAHLRADLHTFALPLAAMDFTVSLLWHPRLEADPAHRWLRACVRGACAHARG